MDLELDIKIWLKIFGYTWSVLYLDIRGPFYIWLYVVRSIFNYTWSVLYLVIRGPFYIWIYVVRSIFGYTWSVLYLNFYSKIRIS